MVIKIFPWDLGKKWTHGINDDDMLGSTLRDEASKMRSPIGAKFKDYVPKTKVVIFATF